MNEQFTTYERIIENLINAVDLHIPLEVNKEPNSVDPTWNGARHVLIIGHGEDYPMIEIHDQRNPGVIDAEELTLASAYAMTGKFIELEA